MIGYGMPMQFAPPRQQATPFPQPIGQAAPYAQPPQRQWQPANGAMPSPAYLASGAIPKSAGPAQLPYKARGVAQDPPPAAKRFVMPSPEDLCIATSIQQANPPAPLPPSLDWNDVHARLDRLKVRDLEKKRLPDGNTRVTLLLPTADPAVAQPVIAVAATEGDAILSALQYAENWTQRRESVQSRR